MTKIQKKYLKTKRLGKFFASVLKGMERGRNNIYGSISFSFSAIIKNYKYNIEMNYGIPYKGSKNKVIKWLMPLLPSGEVFVDLFCGGGGVP